jgi:hypothetical protein
VFTADDIQNRVRMRPFIPLRITTSAGQSFDIYHPDLIMVGRRSLVIGRSSTENPTHFDQVTQVSILHVTALENLPTPNLTPGNGQE